VLVAKQVTIVALSHLDTGTCHLQSQVHRDFALNEHWIGFSFDAPNQGNHKENLCFQ
jgi:hypothetical protein